VVLLRSYKFRDIVTVPLFTCASTRFNNCQHRIVIISCLRQSYLRRRCFWSTRRCLTVSLSTLSVQQTDHSLPHRQTDGQTWLSSFVPLTVWLADCLSLRVRIAVRACLTLQHLKGNWTFKRFFCKTYFTPYEISIHPIYVSVIDQYSSAGQMCADSDDNYATVRHSHVVFSKMLRKKFFTWLKSVFKYSSEIFFVIAAGN